jgi:hypothetical protein
VGKFRVQAYQKGIGLTRHHVVQSRKYGNLIRLVLEGENGKIPDGIGHHRHALRFSFPFPDGMDFLNPPAPRRDMQLPVNHSCWGGSNPEKTLNASAYPPSSVSDCKRPSVLDSLRQLNSDGGIFEYIQATDPIR